MAAYVYYFFLAAVLTATAGLYAVKWAQAYRIYKATGKAEEMIVLAVASILAAVTVYGFSLTLS